VIEWLIFVHIIKWCVSTIFPFKHNIHAPLTIKPRHQALGWPKPRQRFHRQYKGKHSACSSAVQFQRWITGLPELSVNLWKKWYVGNFTITLLFTKTGAIIIYRLSINNIGLKTELGQRCLLAHAGQYRCKAIKTLQDKTRVSVCHIVKILLCFHEDHKKHGF